MNNKIDNFVKAAKSTANDLHCGFYLFVAGKSEILGDYQAHAHNLSGAMMIQALENAVKVVYKGMHESGMQEATAAHVVMSIVGNTIIEVAHEQ